MVKNYQIQVLGIVQGVWFRKYTMEAAKEFHLSGFVENRSDGSVYVEAEGEELNLRSFLDWLQKGSPLSRVEKVNWKEGSVKPYSKFSISR
jgi:acylphosphatase